MTYLEKLSTIDSFEAVDLIAEALLEIDNETFSSLLKTLSKRSWDEASFKQDLGDFGGLELILEFLKNDEKQLKKDLFLIFAKTSNPLFSGCKPNKDMLRESGITNLAVQLFDCGIDLTTEEKVTLSNFFANACSGSDRNREVIATDKLLNVFLTVSADINVDINLKLSYVSTLTRICTQDDKSGGAPVSIFCRDRIL